MSKRRISNRQSARIEKKQQSYQTSMENSLAPTSDGLIITRFGSHALVEPVQQTNRIHCSIRPTIASLVAGDRVVWQSEGDQQGVVVSCYPRSSVLGRPDKKGQMKPIAANITQLIIVVAPKPEVSWPLLDSYLIVAESLNLHALIVLNKIDLPSETIQKQLLDVYQPLGYSILFTARHDEKSYACLKECLNQQISVVVGQSGVGKSSLIAAVLPEVNDIQTGDISYRTALGKHTTSNSCFYHLPTGGALIDSPGVREFGLWHMSTGEIAKGYREFQPYIAQCKFRNCNHCDTLGCAIKEAAHQHKIMPLRYENYVKLTRQFAK
jgi:ribosome biogenesis GTPase